jgi:hypothetical protein
MKEGLAEHIFNTLDKSSFTRNLLRDEQDPILTVYFGTPNIFITLCFGFDYETNPPLDTLMI